MLTFFLYLFAFSSNAAKSTPPMTAPPPLPETMKAGVATGFGDIDAKIICREDWPTPTFGDDHDNGFMIIRVLACALAPGDVRVLSGKTAYVQMPPGGLPYVVGSDVAGMVVQVAKGESKFQVGDYVVSRFDEPKPNGGVAEYRLVKTELSEKCPESIDPIVACGLPASAMAAKRIVEDLMKKDDKVLVIGGSGAVGSSVIQYAKLYGAGKIVAVSSQEQLCLELGADRVIDYRTTKWWEEFKDDPFDVVFDMVNGDNWTKGAHACSAIKSRRMGGKYVALLSGVETEMEAHGMWDIAKLMFGMVSRMIWSRIHPRLPVWLTPEALKLEDGDLKELFADIEEKRLKPQVDPRSPFPFDTKGLREAFKLQKSCHAHGKVVIEISKQKDD